MHPDLQDKELSDVLACFSKESQPQVKILKVIISKQFQNELETIKEEIVKKDTEITNLKTEGQDLKIHINIFETMLKK